ncbi:hypothetical protein ACUNV4_09980 [Granulosicoccus sp. 3-233]|uniref:hypothetical protein n=1 Tax=Granulosicoccus sp. 3-233 TaxID=3417969 RepID=UPI003D333B70
MEAIVRGLIKGATRGSLDDAPVAIARGQLFAGLLLPVLLTVAELGQAETHAVIVNGLGGESAYSDAFDAAADTYVEALQSIDEGEGQIVRLQETATREEILAAIETRAAVMQASDTIVLILVGHGTADSLTWRFNISGPDVTTEDLVAALNGVNAGRQVVVLATSASGAALEALTQPGRVVVTATKSGGEVNAVRFPGYLADAMASSSADYDRNEILTVAEAFRFANARTEAYYEQQNLLASEHARLAGDLASDIPLALLGSLREAKDDPQVAALLDERLTLEDAFKALKARKSQMPVADYYRELEILLIDIARMQQSIDAVTGWSDTDAES